MRVTVIGAHGFVGSAFVRYLSQHKNIEVVQVIRCNYDRMTGTESDVVIEAACNSRKYLAEEQPFEEFDLSVAHRLRTLRDFPADLILHISSVDVYSDLTSPETTREDSLIDLAKVSHYGFHKLLAEQLVQHYAKHWLIVRLAGMVGPGLRKNPVYDILHGQPLRIHPDSQYQFMSTDDVACIVWTLVERGIAEEIFNVCGDGLISPREIARLAGRRMDPSMLEPGVEPRIVNVSIEKIRQVIPVPHTHDTITQFIGSWLQSSRKETEEKSEASR